jgi:hypothetical protein
MTFVCRDGHEWRWYPGRGSNDPDAGEVDLGVCPKCCGRGCENNIDEEALLIDCAQLIDAVKMDWSLQGAWSEWDQAVRDRITKRLRWITTNPKEPHDAIQF